MKFLTKAQIEQIENQGWRRGYKDAFRGIKVCTVNCRVRKCLKAKPNGRNYPLAEPHPKVSRKANR